MLHDFLTTQQTAPPPIAAWGYTIMLAMIPTVLWACWHYYQLPRFQLTLRLLQSVQLIALYAWYLYYQLPLANSLPFYHCRIAMMALLCLPNRSKYKQYFALLGFAGALFALGYPVFDPYDFPHITSFSFILGHYALLANATVYLLRFYDAKRLQPAQLIGFTLSLNAFLVMINHLTGGNYGLMAIAPITGSTDVPLNYLLVSVVLCIALWCVNTSCQHFASRNI